MQLYPIAFGSCRYLALYLILLYRFSNYNNQTGFTQNAISSIQNEHNVLSFPTQNSKTQSPLSLGIKELQLPVVETFNSNFISMGVVWLSLLVSYANLKHWPEWELLDCFITLWSSSVSLWLIHRFIFMVHVDTHPHQGLCSIAPNAIHAHFEFCSNECILVTHWTRQWFPRKAMCSEMRQKEVDFFSFSTIQRSFPWDYFSSDGFDW